MAININPAHNQQVIKEFKPLKQVRSTDPAETGAFLRQPGTASDRDVKKRESLIKKREREWIWETYLAIRSSVKPVKRF